MASFPGSHTPHPLSKPPCRETAYTAPSPPVCLSPCGGNNDLKTFAQFSVISSWLWLCTAWCGSHAEWAMLTSLRVQHSEITLWTPLLSMSLYIPYQVVILLVSADFLAVMYKALCNTLEILHFISCLRWYRCCLALFTKVETWMVHVGSSEMCTPRYL